MADPTHDNNEARYERRAPGWVIRCLKCGFTEPLGKYGIRKWACGRKWTLGWCSRCHGLHCHAIQRKKTLPTSDTP